MAMRRAVIALSVDAATLALVAPLTAQRDGGARQGGSARADSAQGGSAQGGSGQGGTAQGGNRGARGGGGGVRGGAGAPQGRGGQGPFGRGRGNDVQGTSSIRGLVTAGDTNTPLRRAQVTAASPETRSSRSATTDAAGRFELLNLPAGRWTVTASKGGYVSQQYGQRRAFESVDPLTLGDGQRATANFTLPRGGVITGRIVDEYGDAVTGARVEVLRSQMTQGRRRLAPVSVSSQTDDTGAFRVFGLAPGDYYVSARQQPMPFDFGDGPMVLAATFYPGTTTVGDAQRIKVEASSEQSGINFALTSVGAVRVSGTVLDSNGSPAAATLMLQSASSIDGPFSPGMQGRSQADGSFTIRNVAPGEYTLDVMTGQGGRGGGGGGASIDVASMPLVVGNEDVSGLTITTSKGGTLRGTVVADGASTLPSANLQVSMQSLGGVFRGNGLVSQVNTAGAFDLTGLVGSYVLRVDRVPDGWAVKSITVNGKDASDLPFDVRGTDQLSARVVLTNHINELTGTVRSGGQTVTNATVVVFPDNPAQWGFPSRRVRSTRVDSTGLFRIRSFPAGQSYRAVAVDYLEQGEFQDPEFLQKMKARATEVSLGDAETKNIELPLIER
jgi:carboxypeptidase family protein